MPGPRARAVRQLDPGDRRRRRRTTTPAGRSARRRCLERHHLAGHLRAARAGTSSRSAYGPRGGRSAATIARRRRARLRRDGCCFPVPSGDDQVEQWTGTTDAAGTHYLQIDFDAEDRTLPDLPVTVTAAGRGRRREPAGMGGRDEPARAPGDAVRRPARRLAPSCAKAIRSTSRPSSPTSTAPRSPDGRSR